MRVSTKRIDAELFSVSEYPSDGDANERLECQTSEDTIFHSGFVSISDVIPDAVLEVRYYSAYNFVGERIDSYEAPIAYLTREAAYALKNASDELKKKYEQAGVAFYDKAFEFSYTSDGFLVIASHTAVCDARALLRLVLR